MNESQPDACHGGVPVTKLAPIVFLLDVDSHIPTHGHHERVHW